MEAIEVTASARLHLGFYNFLNNRIAYGSLGLAIDRPVIRVVVRRRGELLVNNYTDEYIDDIIEHVVDRLDVPGAEISIYSTIPRHVGLGSTTQLSLAIGYALTRLYGLGYSIRELALRLGRGYVSGIGIAAFEKGGFIIDSGRRLGDNGLLNHPRTIYDLPKPIYWSKVPGDWRFIVIVPNGSRGLDESVEEELMRKPEPLPSDLQLQLYSALVMDIVPGVSLNDIDRFSQGLYKIQFTTGKYFMKHQGGIFCCRETEEIIRHMLDSNIVGVGQSSWGPVAYGVVRGSKKAKRLLEKILYNLKQEGIEPRQVFIAKPRNTGFHVRVHR